MSSSRKRVWASFVSLTSFNLLARKVMTER